MKAKIFSTLFGAFLFVNISLAQNPNLGAAIVYGTNIENIGIRAQGSIPVLEKLEIVPDFTFFFNKDQSDAFAGQDVQFKRWEFNGNVNYLFLLSGSSITPYVMAGINFSSVGVKVNGDSDSELEVGLNIGGGVNYPISSNVDLFFEIRYVIQNTDFDQVAFGLGGKFHLR